MLTGISNPVDDITLIQKVKEANCENSFNTLVERHMPLCCTIYNKFAYYIKTSGACFEDVYNDRYLVFWKSITSFNPDKNTKFSTWLANMVRYQCLDTIDERSRLITRPPEIMGLLIEKNKDRIKANDDKKANELKEYMFNILSQLKDKRIKQIFEIKLTEEPITWKEIADRMGLSNITTTTLFERGKKILKEKLKSDIFLDTI